jgi:hypothetical protein
LAWSRPALGGEEQKAENAGWPAALAAGTSGILRLLLKFFNNYTKNATNNKATIFNTLIIGFIAGPAVSL